VIEWPHDLADRLGGHVSVERRGAEFGVAEQHFKRPMRHRWKLQYRAVAPCRAARRLEAAPRAAGLRAVQAAIGRASVKLDCLLACFEVCEQ
jgi:hypothetical protein